MNFNQIAAKIRFKGTSAALYNSSYTALNDIILLMRQYPIKLEIQCSASDVSVQESEQVATERATLIYDYLVHKGIKEDRLEFKGYAQKLPPTLTQQNGSSDIVRLIPKNME
jgi:outer membrane protein OmpA-like peptidoglycan-associated protein